MITYQVEDWADCWQEMSGLWQAHYEEVALNRDKIRLDPDLDAYHTLNANGQLHVVTVRENGALIGYHIAFVRPHIHYRTSLSAYSDVYYVKPEHRKGMVGVKLFIETEKFLKQRGVERLYTGTKMSKDMAAIFERLGWREVERQFSKYIGDS